MLPSNFHLELLQRTEGWFHSAELSRREVAFWYPFSTENLENSKSRTKLTHVEHVQDTPNLRLKTR